MAIIKPGHEEEVGSAREDADKEGRGGGGLGGGVAIWNREGYCFKFVWCVHTRGSEQLAMGGNAGHLFKVGDNSGTMASEKKEALRATAARSKSGAEDEVVGGGRRGRRRRRRRSSATVSRIKRHAQKLQKIQLECGVKTGFEVGHGA